MDDRPALHSRKPWLPLFVTLALMAGLGGWIGWQWHAQETRNRIEQEQRFSFAVDDIEHTLRERMRAYEMVLRGVAGLVAGSDAVSLDEWMRASDQLQLQDFYPGIQAVALARYATRQTIEAQLQAIRQSGRERFRMYPPGERDEYLVVDYIHPTDWRNRRVLGFDLFSEATRRAAASAARDSGNPVLTGPLRLKQETEQNIQVGVLLYLPLYRANAPITTEEERRRAFLGTLHGAFRLTDLMEGILGSRSSSLQLQLRDAAAPDVPLLAGRRPANEKAGFQRTRNIYMYGRSWQLKVASTPEYEAVLRHGNRTFDLVSPLLAAALFSLLIGGYLSLRERTLRASQRLGLQSQEREARFRQLIEQLPVATLLCNAAGRIELANQSAASLLGSNAGLLAGERVSRYLPFLLGGDSLAQRGGLNQQETQALREDATPVPVALSLTSFNHDEARYYVLNLLDLQARKRDEERFRNVVEASPNAFVLVDSEGRIVMVNRQTELLFGYAREELLGQPVELLLPEAAREAHRGVRQEYAAHPEPRRMGANRELFGCHRDGSQVPVEIGLSPLRSGDEQLVQAVIIDISHRKAAERRLRDQADQLVVANRYKSEFLANMSHELRTPLNSILILSDQLRQNGGGNLTDKQIRHADIIYRAGHDLLQLINDVLDLAKIEAGHLQLKLEPLDLRELLAEIEAALASMAQHKGLRLTLDVAPNVPARLDSDRLRLRQILHNLLTNALKFTEHGEVRVLARCLAQAGGGEVLQIEVHDTGIGIARDQHERIFQAFQQIDGSISRHYGGTGLGLAITQQLVAVLGGRIELLSEPGQGSRFIVELPLPEQRAALPGARGDEPDLLIVAGDGAFAALLDEVGQGHGFISTRCATGNEALAALRERRFAAVILDIQLPDVSGWQVYHELRADARQQTLPVALIASGPPPDDWHDDSARYLTRPVDRLALEQLFIELRRQGHNPLRLLLVEGDPQRRREIRECFEALGYSVTATGRSETAHLAFAEQAFSALAIDFDLADDNGLELLEALERLRPLQGMLILVSSRVPLDDAQQQRLRRYSALLLAKSDSPERIGELVRQATTAGAPEAMPPVSRPELGSQVLLVGDDVRLIYALSADLDRLGVQVEPVTSAETALMRFAEGAFDLVLLDMSQADAEGVMLPAALKGEHGCLVPIITLVDDASEEQRQRCLALGADDVLVKPVQRAALATLLQHWLGLPAEQGKAEEE
ncbi:sensor histidine kinase/response regulator [Stutzerimonas stutzeri TS44]|nr:sensor histidine kinase/response regulator [Stutzerimonas stutzeri TS44]